MGPPHAARFSPLMASSQRAGVMVGAAGDGTDLFADLPSIPTWYRIFAAAGTVVGVYHGYKRNDSVGWAIGWGLLGGLVPEFVIPIALAQGFGERK